MTKLRLAALMYNVRTNTLGDPFVRGGGGLLKGAVGRWAAPMAQYIEHGYDFAFIVMVQWCLALRFCVRQGERTASPLEAGIRGRQKAELQVKGQEKEWL